MDTKQKLTNEVGAPVADNENSITLKIPDNKNLIEFTESEIKSIKIA